MLFFIFEKICFDTKKIKRKELLDYILYIALILFKSYFKNPTIDSFEFVYSTIKKEFEEKFVLNTIKKVNQKEVINIFNYKIYSNINTKSHLLK